MDVIATLDKGKTNYQHYMVPPGMSQEDAKLLAEEFINEQLKLAREARERAKVVADPLPHLEAMREHLAHAMHCVMDSTSPAHASPDGMPLVWSGANEALHSPNEKTGIETAKHITPEILAETLRRMELAHEYFENGNAPPFLFPYETQRPLTNPNGTPN